MKVAVAIAVLVATFPAIAIAQTSTCQPIQNTAERLACYDKANPPIAATKPAAKSKSGAKPAPDQAQLVDRLAIENSRLDAKLKTICRGC